MCSCHQLYCPFNTLATLTTLLRKFRQGKAELPLWLETRDGQSSIAPVIVRAEENQKVQFEGEEAKTFTKKRCQDIGCSSTLIDDVLRGCVAPVQGEGLVAAKSEPVHRRSWWERWLKSEKKSS